MLSLQLSKPRRTDFYYQIPDLIVCLTKHTHSSKSPLTSHLQISFTLEVCCMLRAIALLESETQPLQGLPLVGAGGRLRTKQNSRA